MISDHELDQWSELWRSGETLLETEIAERAQKAVRRFRLWIFLEVLMTVLMGGGATVWAMRAHQPSVTFLAIWVWVSLAIAWIFRLISDWNDFTGVAVATGSYLATLLRRLRSSLRAAEFGGVLFVVQLLVTSTWVFLERDRQAHISIGAYLTLPANIVFAFGTVAFAVWLVRYRRTLRNQIAELEKMQAALGDDSPPEIAQRPPVRQWLDIGNSLISHAIERSIELGKRRLRIW